MYIPEVPADSVDGVNCDRSRSALAGAIMSSLMPALVLPEALGLLAVLELAFMLRYLTNFTNCACSFIYTCTGLFFLLSLLMTRPYDTSSIMQTFTHTMTCPLATSSLHLSHLFLDGPFLLWTISYCSLMTCS